jgi:hypothetical protein
MALDMAWLQIAKGIDIQNQDYEPAFRVALWRIALPFPDRRLLETHSRSIEFSI